MTQTLLTLIILFFLSAPSVFAEANIATGEDLLKAELKVWEINQLTPEQIASHKTNIIGIDPRVNKIVEEKYRCDDLCPAYGAIFLNYQGVDTIEKCRPIGEPEYTPGWHGYAGCRPKPIEINVHLKSGETIKKVIYRGNPEYFLRTATVKHESTAGGEQIPIYTDSSVFLNDIDYIESKDGKKLESFKEALDIPVSLDDSKMQAEKYFEAGLRRMDPYAGIRKNPHTTDEAAILFRKAIERDLMIFKAYFELAKVCQSSEKISIFEKFIKLNQTDPQAYYILGNEYANLSDFNDENGYGVKAVAVLNEAVKLKPDFTDAYWSLAKYYANLLGMYQSAAKNYEKWIELAKPQGERAEAVYQELKAYKQNYLSYSLAKVRELKGEKKYKDAIAELQKVISEHPRLDSSPGHEAMYLLGLTYKESGNVGQAVKTFEKLADTNVPYWSASDRTRALKQLSLIYQERKDFLKARKYLEQAIAIQEEVKQNDKCCEGCTCSYPLLDELKEMLKSIPF